MNSKQVKAALCGLSSEEQDTLKNEYGISTRVSDVGLGMTEEWKKYIAGWFFGNTPKGTSVYNAALHKHVKPEKQRAKEVAKRRKNNRNKKTHRKK